MKFPFILRDPNGLYCGVWFWDVNNNSARGNPASGREVKDTLDAIKARDGAIGERTHSAAMTKEYMDRIISWSYLNCSDEFVERTLQSAFSGVQDHVKNIAKVIKHLFMRCFLTSGWTLWTR
ncbi:MAG TPA: hypothetical protein VGO47_09355 [Chlamydiales bacterium]|jgi:polysaccharide pyruvyl transferase WcaK-like protein|nr:hypothetical protein [Chlamydiales bacterium]